MKDSCYSAWAYSAVDFAHDVYMSTPVSARVGTSLGQERQHAVFETMIKEKKSYSPQKMIKPENTVCS